jgi:15-cis-phytoene desaturase
MDTEVAVLGGGVAGMSAAHELAERGFEVHVYERRPIPGGKARSFESNGLPAEHGFRFFPGFYRHLPDTMQRIPYPGERQGVRGNLKPARDILMLQEDSGPIDYPTHLWGWNTRWLGNIRLSAPHIFTASTGFSRSDLIFIGGLLRKLLGACPERRFADYELEDWWHFSNAVHRSEQYRRMLSALTRSLVAARADELSVRTGGYILLQLQLAGWRWRGHVPSVLNGPTSIVWIDPWRRYLESRGVRFHFRHTVQAIECLDRRIQEVVVTDENGTDSPVRARWYVAAIPAEVMQKLVTPAIAQAEPGLANLCELQFRWMNGVMLYLRRDVPLVHGHSIYVDSPWALTSISQNQFWGGAQLGSVGDVPVSGVLSVDVSNWENDGVVYHKPAMQCSRPEIVQEVLTQIRRHLASTAWAHDLDDDNIVTSFVDEDIYQPNPGGVNANLEPLLINTKGSWAHRPAAVTKIENLFLASDYVRTYTDLATMEGANEAARRAVNGILDRSQSTKPRCEVWPLRDVGGLFTLLRLYDQSQLRRANLLAFNHAAKLINQLAERLDEPQHQ